MVDTTSTRYEDDEDIDDWCPKWRYVEEKMAAGIAKTEAQAEEVWKRDLNDSVNFKVREGRGGQPLLGRY